MHRDFLILFFFLTAGSLSAQFYPLPEFDYSWPEANPYPIPIDEQYSIAPAVVLKDEVSLSVRGRKESFMYMYFERKQRIKIQSLDNGRTPFSEFILPESHDPFYDNRDHPLEKRFDDLAADYLNVQMVYFAARRINPDSTATELKFSDDFQTDKIEIAERFENQFRYIFKLNGIAVGDEFEVVYKYEVPYDFNWLFFSGARIFLNREYPIQQQRIEVAMHKHMSVKFAGAKPDSNFVRKKRRYWVWNNQNLAGCIREPSIRPSLDLPHIIYSLNINSPRFQTRHHHSLQLIPSNYALGMFKYRERNAMWLRRISLEGKERDGQSAQLHAFVRKHTRDIPKDHTILRFDHLHTVIANEFAYLPDDAYFAEKDLSLEKIGDQVSSKVMRETSRYNLYSRLINLLGSIYFTTYILDERIGTLTEHYTANVLFSDFAFAVPYDQYLSVYYPKKDDFGYEPNELPFYLAGTPAFLVDIDRLFFTENYFPDLIQLPGLVEENYRHNVMDANVDIHNKRVAGKMEVELSGQFSTLTRSVYEFGRVDSSINPAYGHRPFWNRPVIYSPAQQTEASVYAPYKRVYNMEFELPGAVRAAEGADYSLSLDGWFNFVTWSDFDADSRVLPFYIDFEGNDFIRLHLNFDQPIEVANPMDFIIREENRFGLVVLEIDQSAPDELILEAQFNIYGDRVEPEKVYLIEELYRAVERMNATQIKINLSNSPSE